MSMLYVALALGGGVGVAQAPWQPKEYPISYWHGPPASMNTLETWQRVKDCNFTFCGPRGGYTREENLKMLDLCQQVGIPAMVVDGRISWDMITQDNWQETIRAIIDDYGTHPALYGYYLQDEPNYECFEALGMISREFEKQDPNHLPYINLFPTYATVQQLGTPTYADHLDKFLSIVKPRVLSYDHYCLMKDGSDRPDYFENLELIRHYGLQHGIPQWNIILSLSHLAYRDPTEGEMRWQVYTSLAYGMKGIMYFTYYSEPGWEAQGEIGIVDSKGQPARLYPIVQNLNGEIKALGPTLLRLTSTGVYHTGTIPQGCRRLGGDAVVQTPTDIPLVIGFFQDAETREYAMIVNRNHQAPVEFDLTILPHVIGVYSVSAEDGMERSEAVTERRLHLQLAPGDGRLFRLETHFDYPQPPRPVTEINFQFDTADELRDWRQLNGLAAPQIRDSILSLTFIGPDPYLVRSFLRIDPDQYTKIKVRMKLSSGNPEGQLFWTTETEPIFRDDKYLNFPIQPDGDWHEYEIPVGEHPKWKGQGIRGLRLDPTTGGVERGSKVEIDWIVGE
ncbi:MAG: hypothetical protein ACUVX8_08185 [Candidatus Zipacnadales bacterium]